LNGFEQRPAACCRLAFCPGPCLAAVRRDKRRAQLDAVCVFVPAGGGLDAPNSLCARQ
jgi:hypothetical protein